MAAALSAVVLGDESGYDANENQKMKLAAMEAMWKTEKVPAGLTIFGIPNEKTQRIDYAIEIPYLLGIMATHSFNTPMLGINDIIEQSKDKIRNGIQAYSALKDLQKDPTNMIAKTQFKKFGEDLGYGLLVKRYNKDVVSATESEIDQAAHSLKPHVAPLFFSFRIMVACGFYFIFLFSVAFYMVVKRRIDTRWFFKMALYSLPLPWVAAELAWVVAEYGRQPWVVEGILPTFMGASAISKGSVLTSLAGFVIFYSVLAVVEMYLMVKYIRLGPDGMEKESLTAKA